LSVRLLSDEEGEVCRKFGVSQFRERDGHKKLCVIRSTFIVDKEGIVRHALYDVQPKGHAAEVYQLVKGLNGKGKHHAHR
jgi:peroxiredoxin Q/BCP